MSTVTRPRGPLPPRIYWTRRVLVLGLVLGTVFGASHLFGGGGSAADGPSARPAAAPAGSASAAPTPDARRTAGPTTGPRTGPKTGQTGAAKAGRDEKKKGPAKPKKTKTPLAVPTGPCADDDVVATPTIDRGVAGTDVAITLELTTLESPACNWQVSPDSLVVKLTSGSDRIWSTQDCPASIETESVVVRKDHPTTVDVVWSGQRSDEECSRTTAWAEPGFYHAEAAALGAEPSSKQFELVAPAAPTVTPSPKAGPRDKPKNRD